MSTPTRQPRGRLLGTTPFVWVADVEQALPYYCDALGFEVAFRHDWEWEGDRYGLAILERDEITLHMRVCECGDYRHTGLAFYQVEVDDVEALHAEVTAAGARLRMELETRSWGVRDFQVEDPEGNRIEFYQHV